MHIEKFLILFAFKYHEFFRFMAKDKDHQVEFEEVASKSKTIHEIFPHEFLENRVQWSI